MKFLKFIPFVYLIIAVFFIVDGIEKITLNDRMAWLSFLFAAVAVFMFFFRRKFSKKMEDRYKK